MATRTPTTRTTTIGPAPSAVQSAAVHHHAEFYFEDLVVAYYDCRRTKRNTANALAFEQDLERNLRGLYDELIDGTYRPGRSICFVVTRPKPREVWAADFRDRVVHHLLYNRIGPRFEHSFIADSCACVQGRGTLYAARRLEAKVRSITQTWTRPAYYLKCDIANFFVSIDKKRLRDLLAARIPEPALMDLTERILFHDPRTDVDMRTPAHLLERVPLHKRLTEQPADRGMPIGNLSSQFFANIYLDVLDQHVKHELGARHYVRYVDDFIILDESPQWLNFAWADIDLFLPARLGLHLNPKKTIAQPIARGIDFVGHEIRPHRRTIRKRTRNEALSRIAGLPEAELHESANSYFGLFRQASHSHRDRARLARLLRRRGFAVDRQFTKIFERAA